jgi:hypothetical protein
MFRLIAPLKCRVLGDRTTPDPATLSRTDGPQRAALAGMPASWKLRVAAAAFPTAIAAIACQAPSIEGTPYAVDTPAESGDDSKSSAKSAPSANASGEKQAATSSAETRAAPVDTTDGGGVSPTPSTTATTPPATPPPTQPTCSNTDLQQCFFCCLDANPNAVPVEESYDTCLSNCADQTCVNNCAAQHATQCAASAPCSAHHACLQANGCFTSDS